MQASRKHLRAPRLHLCALAIGWMAMSPAMAQLRDGWSDPASELVAPADAVAYYRATSQATALLKQERWSDAETLLRTMTRDYPLDGAHWAQLGSALRHQGKHAEAIAAYENAIDIVGPGLPYPGPSNNLYWIAASHAALGQTDAALDALEQMVNRDAYVRRPELMSDTNFATLQDNPRFRALAGKVDTSRMDRVEGWQRDIDVLAEELKRSNPKGAAIPPEFLTRQAALKAAVPTLDDQQVVAGMGQMLATLRRGHTALWLGDPDAPSKLDFRQLPIRLYVFPEGVFVTQGLQGNEDLAGARVLKFGRVDAGDMLKRVAAIQGGESPMQALWISPDLLARPAVLKALGGADRTDRAELTLQMSDGHTLVKSLEVIPAPERIKLNAPPHVPPPMFLRDTKQSHWLEPLPAHDALYAQVNNIMDDDDETMEQFGLRLRRVLAERHPHNLILDLRHNNGGNSFRYAELLRTLVAFSTLEGNRVFTLIGRNVYSAAGNLTTDIERMVSPVFVGEPTSATGNQWGDESMFVLPYSGLTGAFSGARWQLSHPWDQRRSIVPQVPVQLTAASYFKGEDPALDAVFAIIDAPASKP
jgi:hypothetical protein